MITDTNTQAENSFLTTAANRLAGASTPAQFEEQFKTDIATIRNLYGVDQLQAEEMLGDAVQEKIRQMGA